MKLSRSFWTLNLIAVERYLNRAIIVFATIPYIAHIRLEFYASYSICLFMCSLYLAAYQEVHRNLIEKQLGLISSFQNRYGMMLTGLTVLLVFFYLLLSGNKHFSLYYLCISPLANFIGFRRLLLQESHGNFRRIAVLRMFSVITALILSLIFFSHKGEYFLVSLSVASDLIFAMLIFFSLPPVKIRKFVPDKHFYHISMRNLLLGTRPVTERILLVLIVSPAISGIYSLSSQIVMSSIGILTYSLNSFIQSEIARKETSDEKIDSYYLKATIVCIISFPVLDLIGNHFFGDRWNFLSSLVIGLGCAKLITIQNANRFNRQKNRFNRTKWFLFYIHIVVFSVLIPVGFLVNQQTAIVLIYVLSLFESLIHCGSSIMRERAFLFRLTLVTIAMLVYYCTFGK